MKVVAYSIKPFEKEFLAKANQKKHDITLISNSLSLETLVYAEGKDAIIVYTNDDVSEPVIEKLAKAGVRYIATRSASTGHIDKDAAAKYNIKLSNVPACSPEATAEQAVALAFALNRHIITAAKNGLDCDFRDEELIGFNFYGKTAGIIGLAETGQAAAKIFHGMGCKVIGYDIAVPKSLPYIDHVDLDVLYAGSDIISLHLPLIPSTRHIINRDAISMMKPGVMLINTSRGALINTADIIEGLEKKKIGYLGIDVYEHEREMFFNDNKNELQKDAALKVLMAYPNVIITPHQACLTKEALQGIANQTIKNLDLWQNNKCVGNACICAANCRVKEKEVILDK